MGTVFKVHKNDQEFILKHQPKSFRSQTELDFLHQVKGLDNIVQLKEEVENKDDVFTIINFGHRGNLIELLEDEDFISDIVNIMTLYQKVVEGVISLHKVGIIHADLKLENIVVDIDYNPIIIDFDLAIKKDSMGRGRGSMRYLAPEIHDAIYNHVEVLFDEYVDNYSLGVILYALLTGCFPFDFKLSNENAADVIQNLPLVFDEDFNVALRDIILDCLQVKEYRISTEGLLKKVNEFLKEVPTKTIKKTEIYTLNGMAEKRSEEKEEKSQKVEKPVKEKVEAVILGGARKEFVVNSTTKILILLFGFLNLI
jgi:serine/threonine protein kinase